MSSMGEPIRSVGYRSGGIKVDSSSRRDVSVRGSLDLVLRAMVGDAGVVKLLASFLLVLFDKLFNAGFTLTSLLSFLLLFLLLLLNVIVFILWLRIFVGVVMLCA